MGKLFFVVLMLLVMSSFTQAQYKGKYVGWSTGHVYGGGTLNTKLFAAFTHLVNFHITVNTNGTLGTGDLPQSNQANFVSVCHANNVKALLDIGGQGEHAHLVAATATAALQTTLVKNIMAMTLQYGYDGVDLDWEVAEDPNCDNNTAKVAHFKAFHQQVHDSVKAHPPLLITAAVTDDWYPNCSAAVCAMMDQANGMSYDISAANELNDANSLFRLGAPKSNHGIGFDMNSQGAADNLAKCRLAIDNSFGGVMAWDVTGFSAAMLDSLARYGQS
jgi:chitinase